MVKYNIRFGKLLDGELQYAPFPLIVDGVNIWTNSITIHRREGWLPIENTMAPMHEGFYYTQRYEVEGEEGQQILKQYWEEHEALE